MNKEIKEISLREKLILDLGLESCEESDKYRIVDDLVQLVIEKTMNETLGTMEVDEMENLQKYISKNINDLPQIYKEHSKNLERFFIIFNKNLNEFIEKFREHIK